jgi:hypothetical protein
MNVIEMHFNIIVPHDIEKKKKLFTYINRVLLLVLPVAPQDMEAASSASDSDLQPTVASRAEAAAIHRKRDK